MINSKIEFLEGLHSIMQALVDAANSDDWERVNELDQRRSKLLEHIPKGKAPISQREQSLLKLITKADQTLITLSENAKLVSQEQASSVSRNTSQCSQYLNTQKY